MCIHTYTQICVPYRSDRHAYSCFNHIYDKHVNTYPDRLQHDFLIRAPSLNPVRNMTFSYVWHDLFFCAPWLMHMLAMTWRIFTSISIHTCIHIQMNRFTNIYIYTWMDLHIHTYTLHECINSYLHIYICIYICKYMYEHLHIWIFSSTYTYINKWYIYTYIHKYMCEHIHIWIFSSTYIYTCKFRSRFIEYRHKCLFAFIYTYTKIWKNKYMHGHIYTYTFIYGALGP